MRKLLWLFVVSVFAFLPWGDGAVAKKFVTIGTGDITGVYYPTGGAICKLINRKSRTYGMKATAQATGGSVFNINALVHGDLDFGLAQSDRAGNAWKGEGEWKDKGPQEKLRGVFSLHSETVCLIAAVDSGIRQCSDLRGKTVAIGDLGSGTRQNSMDALSTCGLTVDDLEKAESIRPSEAASLLQDGRLAAFFYTVGHPNGSIKEATAGRTKVRFVPFLNLDDLLQRKPFYSKAVIPVGFYEGAENSADVPTIGVKACLLTSSDVPDELVYAVTKEVFTNFGAFRSLHPALAGLDKEQMLKGIGVPLHPGAMKYYREAGLLEQMKGK